MLSFKSMNQSMLYKRKKKTFKKEAQKMGQAIADNLNRNVVNERFEKDETHSR